jgi:hypothetical protein
VRALLLVCERELKFESLHMTETFDITKLGFKTSKSKQIEKRNVYIGCPSQRADMIKS